MWITQNNKIWYSESEYKELQQALEEIREIVSDLTQEALVKIAKNIITILPPPYIVFQNLHYS